MKTRYKEITTFNLFQTTTKNLTKIFLNRCVQSERQVGTERPIQKGRHLHLDF